MSSRIRVSFFAALALLATLAFSSTAAGQVTVGQTAPAGDATEICNYTDPYDELQATVAAGTSYTVPTAGILTSWSTRPGATPGQLLGLKIFRPLGGLSFAVVGADGPRPLASSLLNTFAVSIPVQAGDILGTIVAAGSVSNCVFETGLPGDLIRWRGGNTPVGASLTTTNEFTESRLNISATLLPPPVITSITPAEGSVMGGAKVVIAGANFASVSGVSFGATPATSFAVDSETQITAIAPKSSKLVKAAISVTTIAGLAGAPTTFAYEGCRVPKLKDKKLKAVKKQAKKADCKIGKVKKLGDATAKTGEVVKQNPQPGKILAPGTKIKVTLDG
jgi:hypothetical protein